ncbi:hypothetical protein [Lacunimicrobium album]
MNQVWIERQPLMDSNGEEGWEGETDPGLVLEIGRLEAIMAAYAGPLAEAKLRLMDSTRQQLQFNYLDDEADFVRGIATDSANGFANLSFIESGSAAITTQPLLLASFRSDTAVAFEIANAVERDDVLPWCCRRTRELLDLPAIWHSIVRFAIQLELINTIRNPDFYSLMHDFFEQETSSAAYELWLQKKNLLGMIKAIGTPFKVGMRTASPRTCY